MFYLWWWLQWCRWSLGSSFCELCPEQTTKIQRTVLPVWHDKKRGSQGKIHCKSIAINRSPDRSVSGQHPFFSTFWHAKKKTPGPIFSSKRWPHLMAAPFLVQMYWDQGDKRLLSGDWSVRTSINCYTLKQIEGECNQPALTGTMEKHGVRPQNWVLISEQLSNNKYFSRGGMTSSYVYCTHNPKHT